MKCKGKQFIDRLRGINSQLYKDVAKFQAILRWQTATMGLSSLTESAQSANVQAGDVAESATHDVFSPMETVSSPQENLSEAVAWL